MEVISKLKPDLIIYNVGHRKSNIDMSKIAPTIMLVHGRGIIMQILKHLNH